MKTPTLESLPRWRGIPVFRNALERRSIVFDKYRRVLVVRFGTLVLDEFLLVELEGEANAVRHKGLRYLVTGSDGSSDCMVTFASREIAGAIDNARMRLDHFTRRRGG